MFSSSLVSYQGAINRHKHKNCRFAAGASFDSTAIKALLQLLRLYNSY